jgi:AraC-like DNA-binding protein
VVHLEPHYLCALFKEQTGATIMQYIIFHRIEKAKHLIITQYEKMNEIAEKCGFANYNHFSNTFKKLTGITPMQYRKLTK